MEWRIDHTWVHENINLFGWWNNLFGCATRASRGWAHLLYLGEFLLDVHHTPHNEDENEGVHEETHRGWASIGGRDAWTENSPDETESFGIRDDEKGEA